MKLCHSNFNRSIGKGWRCSYLSVVEIDDVFPVLLKNNYTVAVAQISIPIEKSLVQSQCKDSGGEKVENLQC